jgi:hypothetical protein
MASCGSPAPGRQWGSNRVSHHHPACHQARRGWTKRPVIGLTLLIALVGCAPTLQYGSLPRTDRLDTLRPGVASTDDVLQALGEPRGYGAARTSIELTPRTIWFYEYTVASEGRIDLKILLVFFHGERYDGHLWFSSAQLLERER